MDLVLVDAPCTGIGHLAAQSGRQVAAIATSLDGRIDDQADVLDRRPRSLKPGGASSTSPARCCRRRTTRRWRAFPAAAARDFAAGSHRGAGDARRRGRASQAARRASLGSAAMASSSRRGARARTASTCAAAENRVDPGPREHQRTRRQPQLAEPAPATVQTTPLDGMTMTDQHARQHPHHRFRQPGDAAHRAPRARGGRLLRDPPVPEGRPRRSQAEAEGRDPLRRPGLRAPRMAARARPQAVFEPACRSSASATASRRWPRSSAARSRAATHREFGRAVMSRSRSSSPLFEGVWDAGERYPVWMSHGDRVTRAARRLRGHRHHRNAPFAAVADEKRRFYAVQFHPEVVHTPDGAKLLAQFRAQHRRAEVRLDDGGLPRAR